MLVVLLVTGVAVGGCVAVFLALQVAVLALHLGGRMPALQLEIRQSVIELLFVEQHDLHLATLVVGVTDAAFLFRNPAVIALFARHVRLDLLVAVLTQAALGALVEAHVTVRALAFELRMAFNHLARHDGGLHVVCLRVQRHEQSQAHHQPELNSFCYVHQLPAQYMCTAMT